MSAIIFWVIPLFVACVTAYVITHPINFKIVHADADKYVFSKKWTIQYGGTFKVHGYKIKHSEVMFVCPTKDTDLWKAGDYLVVDTGDYDFERDKYYLFRVGQTYRIAKCKAVDKISHMPPLFDGHETLITHDCMGRVVGILRDKCKVEIV